jgi:hypothetical protein
MACAHHPVVTKVAHIQTPIDAVACLQSMSGPSQIEETWEVQLVEASSRVNARP